jgi:hypothetical protein
LYNTEKEVCKNDEMVMTSLKNQEELYLCLPISDEGEWEPIEVLTPLVEDAASANTSGGASAPMQE